MISSHISRHCVPNEVLMKMRRFTLALFAAASWEASATGQVTYERLVHAANESGNWLTYSGTYRSWRYSSLDQITRQTASRLKVEWVYQMPTTLMVETTPLVVDGIMYFTEPPSNVVALDAKTGRQYWRYRRQMPKPINVCCGEVNRGIAILGDRVFVGTVDAHLVALDARTGA